MGLKDNVSNTPSKKTNKMEKAPGWGRGRGEHCLPAGSHLCAVAVWTLEREREHSGLTPKILCGELTFPQPGFYLPHVVSGLKGERRLLNATPTLPTFFL